MELKITKKQALLIELMCRSAQSDMDNNWANDNIFYEYRDEIKPLMFLVMCEGKEPATEARGLSKHAVSNRRELLKHYSNFLYENGYLQKPNVLMEYEVSLL